MLLTLWCIIVVIGSLWFIGLPVAMVLSFTEDDNETLWIIAPFIGLAVIILVLQNLVYLDVPIRHSTLWLWIGACLLWGWLIKSKRLKPAFKTIPRVLIISAGVGILDDCFHGRSNIITVQPLRHKEMICIFDLYQKREVSITKEMEIIN